MLIDAGWAVATVRAAGLRGAGRHHPRCAWIDMPELLRYAKEKMSLLPVVALDLGRQIHGSGFSPVRAVGYRRGQIDFMNRDDQQMVDWYHRVVALAAQHHFDDRLPRRVQT